MRVSAVFSVVTPYLGGCGLGEAGHTNTVGVHVQLCGAAGATRDEYPGSLR